MKIIFVLENYDMGGVEKVTLQLLKAIDIHAPEHNISVLTESASGELQTQFNQVCHCDSLNKRNNLSGFKQYINQHKPDLVVFTKGGLSKYKLALLFKQHIKTVAIQHVPIDLPDSSKLKNNIRKLAAAVLYRLVNKTVCVSEGIRNNLIESLKLPSNDIIRIYNPVIDTKISELAEDSVEYSDYYVCVGRLHYQKGYDLLVKIITKAKTQSPNIKVVILGDGPDRSKLEFDIKKHDLSNNIIIHGFTKNPYKYIKNAKAILMTSRWEGLPTVLVEAGYLNTQIISFDCRYGPAELTNYGSNGYLIKNNSQADFIQAINLIEAKKFKPKADINDFYLETSVQHYLNLFQELQCKKN